MPRIWPPHKQVCSLPCGNSGPSMDGCGNFGGRPRTLPFPIIISHVDFSFKIFEVAHRSHSHPCPKLLGLVVNRLSGEGCSTGVPRLERVWGVLFCGLLRGIGILDGNEHIKDVLIQRVRKFLSRLRPQAPKQVKSQGGVF